MTAELLGHKNGKVTISRRGIVEFQIGDDGTSFSLDVVQVFDDYCEGESAYLDGDYKIIREKAADWRKWRHDFAQAVVNDAHQVVGANAPQLTRAESTAFLDAIFKEKDKLFPRKPDDSGEKPSSPGNSEVRFSM